MGQRLSANYGWVVVATATAILTVTSGARFLYGVVLKPVSDEFDWSRSSLTVAVLINMVVLSICQPFVGALSDRIGPKRILVGGTVLLGVTLLPLSFATELWQFYLVYGVFVAIALAAASPVNTTALVSQWFDRRRGTALALATSGSAFGQLLIVPLAAWTLTRTDWQTTYRLLTVMLLVAVAPIGLIFLRRPSTSPDVERERSAEHGSPESEDNANHTLRSALNTPSFWLLAFGFFVCGFTMAFANTHFMAYADDMGMSTMHAADVIAVTAVFSIAGTVSLGLLADRYSRPRILALTYTLRGLAFILLIFYASDSLIFGYAVVLGISWTATTPLTAAISADLYGQQRLGVVFGTLFTFMNLGFGVGAFLDAVTYDISGGYTTALIINAVLGITAGFAVLRVADNPVRPPALPGRTHDGRRLPTTPVAAPGD
ncbi:MAG: MFS transporter [Thermomicrobiales bacterium]